MDGRFVELSVRDTGPGIPPQVMERMFEPFFSTKEVGRGTGMGLSLAHGIVHEHGGHIVVDSIQQERTKFRVLHQGYVGIELVKWGIGLALATSLIAGRRKGSTEDVREQLDLINKANYRHVDG